MSLKDEILSRVNGGDTDVQTEGERVGEQQTPTPQTISKPTAPRFQLPPNVGVNALKKAANDVVNAGLPDVMAQKRRENILSYETRKPTQPAATPAPEPAPQYQQPKITRLRDIIDSIRRSEEGTPEEQEKRRRREKSRKSIAAIGDAISAASNLISTTHYAPAAKQTSLSARMQAYYDKLREDREKRRDVYNNAYIRAMEKDNQMAYQQAKDEYDRDYQKASDDAKIALKEKEIQTNKELKEAQQKATEEYRKEQKERNDRRDEETRRHNQKMENKSYGGSRGGNGGRYPTPDGKSFNTEAAAVAHMRTLGYGEPPKKTKRSTRKTINHKGEEMVEGYTDTEVSASYEDYYDYVYDKIKKQEDSSKQKQTQAAQITQQTTTQKKTSSGRTKPKYD